jgi:branched-chain amino acid transport system substrate-binding protein
MSNHLHNLVLVFLFWLVSIVHAAPCSAAPFRIGVVSPLSGTASASGQSVKNSVLLADEKFDKENRVEFIFEDDQLYPKNTVTAVEKLISKDKVNGLIIFGSATSLAVASIAERNKVPMVALSIVDKVVAGRKYVFKHWVPSQVENALIVKEVKRRGYKKVAIVSTTNDAMLALRDHFIDSKAAQIVYSEDFPREETDFRTPVAKINEANPDAVYNLLWSPQPAIFSRALRAGGCNAPIFGVHNLEDQAQIEASNGALEGAWFVTGDDSQAGEYYSEYQKQFGESPVAGGVNAYDVGKIFIEGAGEADLASHIANLKNFHGAYGTYGASKANDFTIKAKIKLIKAISQ